MAHLSKLSRLVRSAPPPPRPLSLRLGQAGLTLMELLVSMTISTVILALTLSTLLSLNKSFARVECEAVANDEAKLLNDYISTAMISVGGGALRPWASVWVEDNWSGEGSDRITFATLTDLSMQCSIGYKLGVWIWSPSSPTCCLTEAFDGQQIVAMTGEGDGKAHWANYTVDSVDIGACKIKVKAGAGASLNNEPLLPGAWDEGVYSVVQVRRLWVDHDTDALMIEEDWDGDGEQDTRLLADRVIDLQAALGYDTAPWDWRVGNTNGNDDEWLYNAEGDTFGSPGQGLEWATLDELRTIMVGVMIGAPTRSDPDSAPLRLLNGPWRERDGWVLRAFTSTTGLRNYDIMR